MTSGQQMRAADIPGQTLYDSNDQKVGKVGQVWLDDNTGQPEWATVNTGLFGTNESFVPLDGLRTSSQGALSVPYSKDRIKEAPRVDPSSGHIDSDEEQRLYTHYGSGGQEDMSGQSWQTSGPQSMTEQTSGQASSEDAMTRSEEHLRARTEQHETGRARLRKYVVTEHEEITVPVMREEVRVEREPITDANREQATSGQQMTEDEAEVILHEERPVSETEVVPEERVRMRKEQVSSNETVSGDMRKERIESEGDITEGNQEGQSNQ